MILTLRRQNEPAVSIDTVRTAQYTHSVCYKNTSTCLPTYV